MPSKQASLFPGDRKADPEYCLPLRDLDRSEVEPLAFKILQTVTPFCEKAEIAGSLRRQRGRVNDIDIVVLPRAEPISSVNWLRLIQAVRADFDAVTDRQGSQLFVGYVPFRRTLPSLCDINLDGHVQVDLYRATPSTWGVQLLVRTGSKEHNVMLCNLALSKGMRLQYSQGLVDKDGHVIAGRTEEEVFAAVGLPFLIPQDREIKEVEAK